MTANQRNKDIMYNNDFRIPQRQKGDFVYTMANVFKALSDPTRLKIIRLIATWNENLFVTEIADKLGITNSAVSQHLKVLKILALLFLTDRAIRFSIK